MWLRAAVGYQLPATDGSYCGDPRAAPEVPPDAALQTSGSTRAADFVVARRDGDGRLRHYRRQRHRRCRLTAPTRPPSPLTRLRLPAYIVNSQITGTIAYRAAPAACSTQLSERIRRTGGRINELRSQPSAGPAPTREVARWHRLAVLPGHAPSPHRTDPVARRNQSGTLLPDGPIGRSCSA